ncbi:cytochrome b, partial [Paracoccus sp. (in: a-proteobacteria)]|uniref:cytochrome b n=1 Tax=Paracoccus sp. TaxID=267 RepID=UPI00396C978E
MRGYSTTARLLHWLVALLILAMIPAGLIMTQEGIGRRLGNLLFLFHKNTGAVLILVIVLRLMWRLTHRPPPLPQSLPQWQQVAARLSHGALYGLMVVMPFSGYVRVRAGGFPVEA